LVFHEVQADLEAEGYEVQPYVLPAVSVNAPHRRDRVWFVAHSRNSKYSGNTREVSRKTNEEDGRWIEYSTSSEQQVQLPIESSSLFGDAADTDGERHTSFRESESIKRNWSGNDGKSEQRSEQTERIDGLSGFQSNATDTIIKGLQGCTDSREVSSEERTLGRERDKSSTEFASINKQSNAADTCNEGLQGSQDIRGFGGVRTQSYKLTTRRIRPNWQNFPTVSPICTRDDGISDRLDSITFSKWRNESIKAGGNAIVPQVVYQIFKTIEQYENLH
jgi:DNA (cytosine-5)-methyltransferase 1